MGCIAGQAGQYEHPNGWIRGLESENSLYEFRTKCAGGPQSTPRQRCDTRRAKEDFLKILGIFLKIEDFKILRLPDGITIRTLE